MLLTLESTEATKATSHSAVVYFSLPTSTPNPSNGGEELGGGENTAIIAAIVSVVLVLIMITTVTIVLMAVLTWWKRNPPQRADGITDISRDNNLIHGGKQYNTGDYYVRTRSIHTS